MTCDGPINRQHCPGCSAIGQLRDALPGVPFVALTATATDRVRADVIDCLRLNRCAPPRDFYQTASSGSTVHCITRCACWGRAGLVEVVESFDRPNLYYSCRPMAQSGKSPMEDLLPYAAFCPLANPSPSSRPSLRW